MGIERFAEALRTSTAPDGHVSQLSEPEALALAALERQRFGKYPVPTGPDGAIETITDGELRILNRDLSGPYTK